MGDHFPEELHELDDRNCGKRDCKPKGAQVPDEIEQDVAGRLAGEVFPGKDDDRDREVAGREEASDKDEAHAFANTVQPLGNSL